MRESLALRERLRDAVEKEIADRTAAHQDAITRVRSATSLLLAAGAPAPTEPLAILAHGDSWFD